MVPKRTLVVPARHDQLAKLAALASIAAAEIGFNQARYLYRMKNEINAELRADWPIIENNRLGYYRLDVDPGRIQINVENLKGHPDYEIRSLTAVQ